MPKRTVRAGNIRAKVGDQNTGIAIGHGAQTSVTLGAPAADPDGIGRALAAIQAKVDALAAGQAKAGAQDAVDGLTSEAAKGEQARESEVTKWFRFLALTAPDAWQVAVDSFVHPLKGLNTVFQKVAEKARAEQAEQKS